MKWNIFHVFIVILVSVYLRVDVVWMNRWRGPRTALPSVGVVVDAVGTSAANYSCCSGSRSHRRWPRRRVAHTSGSENPFFDFLTVEFSWIAIWQRIGKMKKKHAARQKNNNLNVQLKNWPISIHFIFFSFHFSLFLVTILAWKVASKEPKNGNRFFFINKCFTIKM